MNGCLLECSLAVKAVQDSATQRICVVKATAVVRGLATAQMANLYALVGKDWLCFE